MPSAYPEPGERIGRFRIVSQLGAGGMGVVYSAVEENLDRVVALCDLDELLEGDGGDPQLSKDGTETIDGQEVVRILDADGATTSHVAVDQPHYVLRLDAGEVGEVGEFNFSEFDAEVDVEAPPEDEITDLDDLP